jgi:hypothetical protein
LTSARALGVERMKLRTDPVLARDVLTWPNEG